MSFSKYSKWLLPILLVISIICFFVFGFDKYLNYNSIKLHRDTLLQLTKQNYLLTVFLYILAYILIVTLSVPGAVFLTLVGGFLFGLYLGTIYVVCSATIGAMLLFLIVKSAFGEIVAQKAGTWVNKLAQGFKKNAFNYLLVLRFIPLFPFWVVNIVAAVLNVNFYTFFASTMIGIIPGSFVYVSVGNGLNSLFISGEKPNLSIILTPPILLPLIGLAILSILPIGYKKFKEKQHE